MFANIDILFSFSMLLFLFQDDMEIVNLNAIEEAAQRVKGHIHVTPVMTCGMLNNMALGRNLFFKCELLQKTGSFKASILIKSCSVV